MHSRLPPHYVMACSSLMLGLLSLYSSYPGPGPAKPGTHSAAKSQPTSLGPELYLGRPRLLIERLDPAHVRLRWNAVPETATQGYRVERSADGDHWVHYDYVPVSRDHRYRYDDTCRLAVYYRVVRLDFSGSLTGSPPVRSTYGQPLGPLLATPNPARGPVRILGRDPALSVDVINGRGELVHQVFAPDFTTNGLAPGTYVLRQGQQIARLVVR